MSRATLDVSRLQVQSFEAGGAVLVMDRRKNLKKQVRAAGDEDLSDTLWNSELCDTRRHCSEYCEQPTNICYACG